VNHIWVEINIIPIHPIVDDVSGQPVIIYGPEGRSTQYGCQGCDSPLTSETLNTACAGQAVDIQPKST
jgi:hypothetical protein